MVGFASILDPELYTDVSYCWMCAFVVFHSSSGLSRENYFNPLRHNCSGLKLMAVYSTLAVYCSSAKQAVRVQLHETIRSRNGKCCPVQLQVWAFQTKITLDIVVCVGIKRPDEKRIYMWSHICICLKETAFFPQKNLLWLVVMLQTILSFSSEDWNFNIWLEIFKIGNDQFLRTYS